MGDFLSRRGDEPVDRSRTLIPARASPDGNGAVDALQQPFGGARASGTNDKAGSMANLLRWTSQRSIKETFVPARDYRYPFMAEE